MIVSDVSELGMVVRSISANVQRQGPSSLGRVRGVVRLKQLGMPEADIARLYNVGLTTIGRDLAVGTDAVMIDHIRNRHITATHGATLMKAAIEADREVDFKDAFHTWLNEMKVEITKEEKRRRDNDEDPLSDSQTWPQKYLSGEQVKTWRIALEKNLPLTEAGFRFKAMVRREKGQYRLDTGNLSRRRLTSTG